MAEKDLKCGPQAVVLKRRGFPVFESNPSVGSFPVRIRKTKQSHAQEVYMIAPGTGEVLAKGDFAFMKETEVDSEEFVKVYLDGVRKYGELKKAGALLFEFVYRELSGKNAKDKDTIMLSYLLARRWKPDLAERTYFRGMHELLAKDFIFRTLAADVYFVNVRFMFNGDRMVLGQAYKRRREIPKSKDLPLFNRALNLSTSNDDGELND
jgi:hypothetical protein